MARKVDTVSELTDRLPTGLWVKCRYIVIDLPYPHWEAKRTVGISSDSTFGLTLRDGMFRLSQNLPDPFDHLVRHRFCPAQYAP